jgi:hypothetical protein
MGPWDGCPGYRGGPFRAPPGHVQASHDRNSFAAPPPLRFFLVETGGSDACTAFLYAACFGTFGARFQYLMTIHWQRFCFGMRLTKRTLLACFLVRSGAAAVLATSTARCFALFDPRCGGAVPAAGAASAACVTSSSPRYYAVITLDVLVCTKCRHSALAWRASQQSMACISRQGDCAWSN